MNDITYRVDKENKIVICWLSNCELIPEDRIHKYASIRIYDKDFLINGTFKGVARCSDEDEFDVEYGKKLALSRAKAKRCKAINEELNRFIKKAEADIARLKKYGIHKVPEIDY